MQTVEITVYKYEELGEKAKEKVKEWYNADMQLFDKYDREEWERRLGEFGYSDIDIQYSGFCSQGDGASIACTVDVMEFLKRNQLLTRFRPIVEILRKHKISIGIKILRSAWGHYVHEKLLYADVNDLESEINYHTGKNSKAINNQVEAIAGMVLEEVQEKSRELYGWLQADYGYHYTDGYIIGGCDSNGYLFDIYGNPSHHLIDGRLETV